jgi:nucleotide-binding universal stress UspA family protein
MSTNGWTVQGDGASMVDQRDDIVVGIDESRASVAALRWAADQARASARPLRLVHTLQLPGGAADAMAAGAPGYIEAAKADARARATRWVLDTLGGDAAQVRWTLEVTEGAAGPNLVEQSKTAHLLVVGTREHRGLRRAISGSVSHYCVSHTEVPVVAVPAPSSTDGAASADRDAMLPGPLF